jgi:hypothetical protein
MMKAPDVIKLLKNARTCYDEIQEMFALNANNTSTRLIFPARLKTLTTKAQDEYRHRVGSLFKSCIKVGDDLRHRTQ